MSIFIPLNLQAQDLSKEIFRQEGIASWYGNEFNGRPTASGEIFDSSKLTAAHLSLPFGTMLVVTNQHNNKKVTVRVNDRGPFVAARIIDVSRAAAEQLDMISTGTAPVVIESIERIAADTSTAIPEEQPSAEAKIPSQLKLSPQINIAHNKAYRLQIGSYKVARNAVETFDKLKNAGLNPAYERHEANESEYFRVVLAGVPGTDVELTTEKLKAAGFREALIRAEN